MIMKGKIFITAILVTAFGVAMPSTVDAAKKKGKKKTTARHSKKAVQEEMLATVDRSQPYMEPEEARNQILIYNPDTDEMEEKIFTAVEISPSFPGGEEAMRKWVAENMKYPEAAEKNKEEGRSIVRFVVEKDGSVTNAKIVKGATKVLDEETLRLVGMMPKWVPAENGNRPVRCYFTMPINYKLVGGE